MGGLHYAIGMLAWMHFKIILLFGSLGIRVTWFMILDAGFSMLFFLGHAFTGLLMNDNGKTLVVVVALEDRKTCDHRISVTDHPRNSIELISRLESMTFEKNL